ncbi:peptide-methionine (S)-S-oxide reductase MsrA [Faecalibacter sp. LW9]|uniref:peptide-methionine (S)-S-oxide reductase MsrA n=1 Tax=Faecalibacter sp. LW9 TaxID=3103144 RepID=UPI002AFDE556|nr:peptide-methionine (S)-S-oxide reductase MsrA [Faecalibacter sp. LW9]
MIETAIFGAGCFWCVEGVYNLLQGVKLATSGYSGGTTENPTYKEVCTGETNHAEVVKIDFDPSVISYDELLEAFWTVHDPTSLNRQGEDVGTQYRSVIYYLNEEQKAKAEAAKAKLDASGYYDKPIVTMIEPFDVFYPAEDYHQGYYNENPNQPYCSGVVGPKIQKFRAKFADKLK